MTTPNKDTVNGAALAAQTALKDAANLAFIAAADIIIAEMQNQGKFKVSLPVIKPASFSDISTYYMNLGYGVFYGQCSSWGEAEWAGVWSYPYSSFYPSFHICNCKMQCNMTISWK